MAELVFRRKDSWVEKHYLRERQCCVLILHEHVCTCVFNKWWGIRNEETKHTNLESSLPLSYVVFKSGEYKLRLPRFSASSFHYFLQGDARLLTPCEHAHWNYLMWRETGIGKNIFRLLVPRDYKLIARPLANDLHLVVCADQLLSKTQIRSLIFGNNILRDMLLLCLLD